VLVTPESALSDDFMTFLNRKRILRQLDRIIIDECHIVLNDQTDFRPQMQQLGKLVAAKTQMVLLTATLPPCEEGRLFERMHFPPSSVSMFRTRTSRPNIAYGVWRPTMENQRPGHNSQWVRIASVVRWIKDRIQRHSPGKVIVYASTVIQAKQMAQELACEAYFHDQIDKSGILERFQSGQQGVIVATSALGMGLDISNIYCIIHLGRPRSLLEYGQESGHAGRDGKPSEAVVIIPNPEPEASWDPEKTPSLADQGLVQRYLDVANQMRADGAPRCRRVVLDEYFDGVLDGYIRRHCRDNNAEESPCDACCPDWLSIDSIMATPYVEDNIDVEEPVEQEPRTLSSEEVTVGSIHEDDTESSEGDSTVSPPVAATSRLDQTIPDSTKQIFREQDVYRGQFM
jgi:superfamily II DNA helicase RecQ